MGGLRGRGVQSEENFFPEHYPLMGVLRRESETIGGTRKGGRSSNKEVVNFFDPNLGVFSATKKRREGRRGQRDANEEGG